jgi:hypothetical protein
MSDDKVPPYITQWCANGGHDGIKALNFRGSLLPSCQFRYDLGHGRPLVVCMCKCHNDMREVLEMMRSAGKDMPVKQAIVAERTAEVAAIVESLAAVRKPLFAPTDSGRLAPGQLEQWVLDVLDLGIEGFELTIEYIAMEIAFAHKGYSPSHGAIQNVLQGWADVSYIKLGYKPIRVLEKYEGLKQVRSKVRPFGNRPRLG